MRSATSSVPPVAAVPRLSIWPDYPEALCNLGAALQGLGKSAEAVDHLDRALELRPDFVVAHSNLGIALRDLGRKDEALEHFRRAVELDADVRSGPDQPGADAAGSGQGRRGSAALPGGGSPRPELGGAAPQPGQHAAGARAPGRCQGFLPRSAAAGPEAGACRTPISGWCCRRKASSATLSSG